MDIAAAADWATVLAVVFAAIASPVWWWKNRKRRQRVVEREKSLREAIDSYNENAQQINATIEEPQSTDATIMHQQLSGLWNMLWLIGRYHQADFELTHGKTSLWPDIRLRSPIAPRNKSD